MRVVRIVRNVMLWSVATIPLLTTAVCQTNDQSLFLLNGFPASKYLESIPTILYRVSASKRNLETVEKLSEVGADAIVIDYDDHFVAVTSPRFAPNKVEVIHFGESLASDTKVLNKDISSFVVDKTRILTSTGGNPPMLGFLLAKNSNRFETLSIGGSSTDLSVLTPRSCSLLVEGSFGVGEVWDDIFEVQSDGGKLMPSRPLTKYISCGLDLELPQALKQSNSAIRFVTINTKDIAVLTSSDQRSRLSDAIGFQINQVFDKNAGKWTSVQVPGFLSRSRAFGEWIAYVVLDRREDHKSTRPASEHNESESSLARTELDNSGWYIPGVFFLYNAKTDGRYTITTGQSDSEPLLISGDTLFFRVNTSIYTVDLGGQTSVDLAASHLVISDPRIGQVHWAFLGPR
jgi:hypothetical protein